MGIRHQTGLLDLTVQDVGRLHRPTDVAMLLDEILMMDGHSARKLDMSKPLSRPCRILLVSRLSRLHRSAGWLCLAKGRDAATPLFDTATPPNLIELHPQI